MIREFHKDELDVVTQLWMNSVTASHPFIPREYWLKLYGTVRNEHLMAAKTYVFGEFGRLKGFISILEDTFIGAFFVDPEYWRQGVGTKLLDYCKERFPRLCLSVYRKNLAAVNFYKSRGFRITAERVDDATGEAEYSMEWESPDT